VFLFKNTKFYILKSHGFQIRNIGVLPNFCHPSGGGEFFKCGFFIIFSKFEKQYRLCTAKIPLLEGRVFRKEKDGVV